MLKIEGKGKWRRDKKREVKREEGKGKGEKEKGEGEKEKGEVERQKDWTELGCPGSGSGQPCWPPVNVLLFLHPFLPQSRHDTPFN